MTNKNQSAIEIENWEIILPDILIKFNYKKDSMTLKDYIKLLLSVAEQRGREEGYAEGWRDAEEIGIEQVRITEQAVKGGTDD